MKKLDAEKLAIQLTTEILRTTKNELIFTNQSENQARNIADFIKALSNRFQSDLDDNVDLPL